MPSQQAFGHGVSSGACFIKNYWTVFLYYNFEGPWDSQSRTNGVPGLFFFKSFITFLIHRLLNAAYRKNFAGPILQYIFDIKMISKLNLYGKDY